MPKTTPALNRLALAVLALAAAAQAEETIEVKARDLTLNVPKSWKQEEPSSSMRAAQFRIPKVEGDKEDGELAVFTFPGGGSVDANLKRWVAQFQPDGRTAACVKGKCAQGEYYLLDVSGTYKKSIGPPMAGKSEDVPGSRMLALIVPLGEKGMYFVKLTGPDKTVAAQADAMRASVGGDKAKEEEVKL
ncbi:MAG: hypothetical protein M5U26_29680 [Planctomycetota bacterium]|nr:hypothetical protein [Planctomycetota bacterium]